MKKYVVVYPDSGLIYPYKNENLAEKAANWHKSIYKFNVLYGWVNESDLIHEWKYLKENNLFNQIEI